MWYLRAVRCILCAALLLACIFGQTTLRQAAAKRALLVGAAADADEFGSSNRLDEPAYASTLAAQYNMLEPENAMKWNPVHPARDTYSFGPPDKLVAFANAHGMKVRGHNLLWHAYNPDWVAALAKTASPETMAAVMHEHIDTVVGHYKGEVFAWDVVNEAVSDSASGNGTDLRDSIWFNQPGIGASGTGYIEQAFRWAHAADPNALLFYNDYNIEAPGKKFEAVYNMLKDFVTRGVPINGLGIQMHIDASGFPSTAGLTQNMERITALGLQLHITEMDVRVKVTADGQALAAGLDAQAQTYARILGVCLANPGCTAFQTWGFTDKYSWIPAAYPGYGAALPFDANYNPKPAVSALIKTLETTPPVLKQAAVVNAASYSGGAVSPGELVTLFGVDYGPEALLGTRVDDSGRLTTSIDGAQVLFDGVPATMIYALAGQVSAVVPFSVDGREQTALQYSYSGVVSNTVTLPVAPGTPGIFAADASGAGSGAILNADSSFNSPGNPARGGTVVQIFATGGGSVRDGAMDGALASSAGTLNARVTATVGGLPADVTYSGPAPGEVYGVIQVNVVIPTGLARGDQSVIILIDGVPSQNGITVAVAE